MNQVCIRAFADPVQISECKSTLEELDNSLTSLTKIFNLAGNGVRLKIIFLLYREKKMCPCDLSDVLGISVGGISQHLRKLKDGGLIRDNKVGQTVFYSLIDERLGLIKSALDNLLEMNKETIS